ncbi:MAG: CopK family periplasmic copper-binding protein [Chromatiaceae bacterium]
MLQRTRLVTAILVAVALSEGAAEPATDRYELKDGSMLYVRPDGTMPMVDAQGKPMRMADNVEMELKEGNMLMMKNRHVWIQVGPPGKGFQYLRTE